MQAQPGHRDRTAVAVVARIRHVLHVDTAEHATPHVRRVVGLRDALASVVQVAVAEQEAQPTQREVLLMIG